jgi:basic membrane protein A
MIRMRIITLFTALIMVGVYLGICYIGILDEQKTRLIKVGFIYDGDESAPYTYNFIRVQEKPD